LENVGQKATLRRRGALRKEGGRERNHDFRNEEILIDEKGIIRKKENDLRGFE